MTDDERERIRSWIRSWAEVDAVQQQLRRERLRYVKTKDSIAALNMAFQAALRRDQKRTNSGLVEFHRLLANSK